jgi:putative tryptophan/tyrosine transport system substrate-binding protein
LLTTTKLADWALDAIRKGLEETGSVEGRNQRSAQGQFDRLPELATDLVNSRVAVILATGSSVPARVAKAATSTIPIVFAYGGDPVADGLVASLNRPGGNVTGATFIATALTAKRLEFLRDIAPRVADVALLVNPKSTIAESQIKDANEAAQALGVRIHVVSASSESTNSGSAVTRSASAFNRSMLANASSISASFTPSKSSIWRRAIRYRRSTRRAETSTPAA